MSRTSRTEDRRRFLACAAVAACVPVAASATEECDPAAVEKAVTAARDRAREGEMRERASYGKALVERFGPEAVAVIEATTIRQTKESLEKASIEDRGLGAVKERLWNHIGPPFEWQLVSETKKRLEFRVSRCPYASTMRQLGAGDLGYAYYCAYDIGFCQGLSAAIRFTRTKTLMKGDEICNHTYELD